MNNLSGFCPVKPGNIRQLLVVSCLSVFYFLSSEIPEVVTNRFESIELWGNRGLYIIHLIGWW